MAKHKFISGVTKNGNIAQCARCGQIAHFEKGKVPDFIAAQECPRENVNEDVNQAAPWIIRETNFPGNK